MMYTRRELGKLMLTSIPAAAFLTSDPFGAQTRPKPNSKVAGVQIGMNVPYNYGSRTMNVDETLDKTVQLGVNAVEMRSAAESNFHGTRARALQRPRTR